MGENIQALWEEAAGMDVTLAAQPRDFAALREKQVRPERYNRRGLFSKMIKGHVSLLRNFPVRIKQHTQDPRSALSQAIRNGFPVSQKARVQTGPSRTQRSLRIPEVMRRWEGNRAILGVTDLHFRGKKFADAVDFSALSDFDILSEHRDFVRLIEMMTLVISSRGNVTDSHQDDCDGSNHCFVGQKLWLAWDRVEGKAEGFQDVDRDQLNDWAAFDLPTFLKLSSSCWFIVQANETLFLPGNLAHKVITIKPYIGIGGFHVSLPGYLRTLKRWVLYDTLDIEPKDLLCPINRALIRKIERLKQADPVLQERWGLRQLKKAVQEWNTNEDRKTKRILLSNPAFAEFLQSVQVAGKA